MDFYREAPWGCSAAARLASTRHGSEGITDEGGPLLPGAGAGLGCAHCETAHRELGMCSQVQVVAACWQQEYLRPRRVVLTEVAQRVWPHPGHATSVHRNLNREAPPVHQESKVLRTGERKGRLSYWRITASACSSASSPGPLPYLRAYLRTDSPPFQTPTTQAHALNTATIWLPCRLQLVCLHTALALSCRHWRYRARLPGRNQTDTNGCYLTPS